MKKRGLASGVIILIVVIGVALAGITVYIFSSGEGRSGGEETEFGGSLPIYPEAIESSENYEVLSLRFAGPLPSDENRIKAWRNLLDLPPSTENLLPPGWSRGVYKTASENPWNILDWYKKEMEGWEYLENLGVPLISSPPWSVLGFKKDNRLATVAITFGGDIYLAASPGVGFVSAEGTEKVSEPFSNHPPIRIEGNEDFTKANGVVGGNGTFESPYIIEDWGFANWDNYCILVENTTVPFIIRNCLFENGGTGVVLSNVKNARVENCTFRRDSPGLIAINCENITVTESTFEANFRFGVVTEENSIHNTFTHNIFKGSWPSPMVKGYQSPPVHVALWKEVGIWLGRPPSNSYRNLISHNTFENFHSGISISSYRQENNTISYNSFKNNGTGINVSLKKKNMIAHNTFENNAVNISP